MTTYKKPYDHYGHEHDGILWAYVEGRMKFVPASGITHFTWLSTSEYDNVVAFGRYDPARNVVTFIQTDEFKKVPSVVHRTLFARWPQAEFKDFTLVGHPKIADKFALTAGVS